MRRRILITIVACAILHSAHATAQSVDPAVAQWTADAFGKPRVASTETVPSEGLCVLRQSHKVLVNRTVWDTPITMADSQFTHGIYMDAPAALQVMLPRPASQFTAQIGIDNNNSTKGSPDTPSARFHASVGGKRVFSSSVRMLKDGPLAITVPIEGARDFVLEVDDGDNGRSHDQCVWADAAVTYADGTKQYLDTLRIIAKHTNRSNVAVSFLYGGQPSDQFLPDWQRIEEVKAVPEGERRTITWLDPKTGLRIEVENTQFRDAAAVDWVCRLTNTGKSDTPIIEDLLPFDAELLPARSDDAVPTLRWSNGDGCTENSFLPHDEPLAVGAACEFAATSSDTTCLPFFNLSREDAGWIVSIGWTGRWKASFSREQSGAVRVAAGMQTTHFVLKPGERIRTPRIVLLRYKGRLIDGNNAFRRLMLAHYVPRDDAGPAMPPVTTNSVAGLWLRSAREKKPLELLNQAGELSLISRAAEWGAESYWMDAYWFPQPWYDGNIGNWYPRPADFPGGLKPLADAAHQRGLKFILWFAPLHINAATQWARDYPQFIHGGGNEKSGVWKLGDPAARESLIAWLSDRRREWDFDVYREDFGTGMPPEEGDDRIGIAEMKHIEGFYDFWSELKRRNHGLLIDNCSGGGRRIDIETAPLAYCLWRSDFNDVGEGLKDVAHWPLMGRADQVMVTGLSLYYPLHTGPVWDLRPYSFRSAMNLGIVIYTDTEGKTFSADMARDAIAELKSLRPLFLGDIYPLLPLTTRQEDWYAYQLDRPDLGRGCAFVFRRPGSPDAVHEISLENILPDAQYAVSITGETYRHAEPQIMTGRELVHRTIQIDTQPGSVLLQYEKQPSH